MNLNETGLDAIDQELLAKRIALRDQIDGPKIGDYVRFPSGELERLSHDWGAEFQTSPSGAFFLQGDGLSHLSCGGLNPSTPRDKMESTNITLPGSFWFFHHDQVGPGRGVYFKIPCRVFQTSAEYTGSLGRDFQSKEIEDLKEQFNRSIERGQLAS